jgi:hypothetical protein
MKAPRTVELTAEEIETINQWYCSALGESATNDDDTELSLIRKLGITGNASGPCSWCGTMPHRAWRNAERAVCMGEKVEAVK